jgi:hypothetical protein
MKKQIKKKSDINFTCLNRKFVHLMIPCPTSTPITHPLHLREMDILFFVLTIIEIVKMCNVLIADIYIL